MARKIEVFVVLNVMSDGRQEYEGIERTLGLAMRLADSKLVNPETRSAKWEAIGGSTGAWVALNRWPTQNLQQRIIIQQLEVD